jgi:hypothetical protein
MEVSLHQYSATPSHMLYAHTLVTLRTKFSGLSRSTGALVMINFAPDFVSCKAGNNKNGLPDPVPEGTTMEKVVEHIRHVGQLIGYDYVSINADCAGIPSTPEGLDEGCREEFAPGVEGD